MIPLQAHSWLIVDYYRQLSWTINDTSNSCSTNKWQVQDCIRNQNVFISFSTSSLLPRGFAVVGLENIICPPSNLISEEIVSSKNVLYRWLVGISLFHYFRDPCKFLSGWRGKVQVLCESDVLQFYKIYVEACQRGCRWTFSLFCFLKISTYWQSARVNQKGEFL